MFLRLLFNVVAVEVIFTIVFLAGCKLIGVLYRQKFPDVEYYDQGSKEASK